MILLSFNLQSGLGFQVLCGVYISLPMCCFDSSILKLLNSTFFSVSIVLLSCIHHLKLITYYSFASLFSKTMESANCGFVVNGIYSNVVMT